MKKYFLPISFFCSLILACEKQKMIVEPPPIVEETPLIILPSDWKKDSTLSYGMGKNAAVFQYKKPLNGQPFKAFAFVFNLNDTTITLSTALNKNKLTPNQWLNSMQDSVLAIINGGFFDLTNGQSYSLVVSEGKMLSPNVKALTRTYNGVNTSYYPTRCAFGIENRKPSVAWIYNVSGILNYEYPLPSPNALNGAPQPQPTTDFPAGGKTWSPNVAIGGSPMLLKEGNILISDEAEMIDVSNKTGRSRSAIGYTATNRVILLAVEKSSANGTIGASLAELAQLLKDMGCTNAINLDGGGSTCLLVNNRKVTNIPEAGSQRAVSSVIVVKKK
jgi:hypothetical protein